MDLTKKTCVPCRGGIPPLKEAEVRELLAITPGWELLDEGTKIRREFKPYLGWQWGNTYGETKELGGGGADWKFVVGISGWL